MFSYYTSLILLSVFAQFIMLNIISSDHLLPKESKTYFRFAVYTIMAIALSEWIAEFIKVMAPEHYRMIDFFLFIMQILSPVLPLIVGRIFKKYKHVKIIYALLIINFIIHTMTFTEVLYISSNGIFEFGNMYIYDDFMFMLSLVLMSWNIYSFCKNYQSTNAYILILTIVLMVYANLLRTLHAEFKVVWFAGTVGLIFVYAYYGALTHKIDSSTHVLNRRCFESRFKNLNRDSYIVLIDLNKFKEINDTQGHTFGDHILKEIAEIIQKTYNKHGDCFRIGGDEFCVITKMKNCDIESLNKKVNDTIVERREIETLLPSVAIGYSEFKVGKNTLEEAFEEADSMMYYTKGKCRSCVCENKCDDYVEKNSAK